MPISIEWNNDDHKIVMMTFEGAWTIQELIEALDDVYGRMERENHDVYAIVNFTNGNTLPGNILSVRGMVQRKQPDNNRFSVMVGANMMARTMVNMIATMVGQGDNIGYADTVDAAYAMIDEKIIQNAQG